MRFLFLLLAALAACSTPTGPRPAPLPELKESARVRALWTARAGNADSFVFEPALADGAVFSAARDGTVMRVDAASGHTAFGRQPRSGPPTAGPSTEPRLHDIAPSAK